MPRFKILTHPQASNPYRSPLPPSADIARPSNPGGPCSPGRPGSPRAPGGPGSPLGPSLPGMPGKPLKPARREGPQWGTQCAGSGGAFPGARGLVCHAQDSPGEGELAMTLECTLSSGLRLLGWPLVQVRAAQPWDLTLNLALLSSFTPMSPSLPLIFPAMLGRTQGNCWGPMSEMSSPRSRERLLAYSGWGKTGIGSRVFRPPALGFLRCSLSPHHAPSFLQQHVSKGRAVWISCCALPTQSTSFRVLRSLKPSTNAGPAGPLLPGEKLGGFVREPRKHSMKAPPWSRGSQPVASDCQPKPPQLPVKSPFSGALLTL